MSLHQWSPQWIRGGWISIWQFISSRWHMRRGYDLEFWYVCWSTALPHILARNPCCRIVLWKTYSTDCGYLCLRAFYHSIEGYSKTFNYNCCSYIYMWYFFHIYSKHKRLKTILMQYISEPMWDLNLKHLDQSRLLYHLNYVVHTIYGDINIVV